MKRDFYWSTDSEEDYVHFCLETGDLSVEEDLASVRTITLSREAAEDLGIVLIDWAKR